MHSRQRRILSACFVLLAASLLWLHWNRHGSHRTNSASVALNSSRTQAVLAQPLVGIAPVFQPAHSAAPSKWIKTRELDPAAATPHLDRKFPWRLRNTNRSLKDLAHSDRALLLRNAFIDTRSSEPLPLPAKLRSGDESGFYLVQASHAPDPQFLQLLASASARIVTYIPNNAYLVEASRAALDGIADSPLVAVLMPYEPYMKLTPSLIPAALGNGSGSQQLVLNTSAPETTRNDIAALGGKVLATDRGAFDVLLKVEVPANALTSLAASPVIHLIEPLHPRKFANDRTAFLLQTSSSVTNRDRYLNLSGSNILVNINDSGVDTNHPDVSGRIFSIDTNALTDPVGHGTHVAATLLGNGSATTNVTFVPQGSVAGASYQGEAPKATGFVLPVDLRTSSALGDHYLQTTARTYANTNGSENMSLISNNSWGYDGAFDYDSASASYDAASRDALPEVRGEQPIVYVFAAGNDGNGGDNGVGGFSDVVPSPANAKNIITVGATESARNLTNAIVYDQNNVAVFAGNHAINGATNDPNGIYQTNAIYAEATDTDTDVASFSSRGNVGIGTEGDNGRFKPDVVAPGEFIISARSEQWDLTNEISPVFQPDYYWLFRSFDDPFTNQTKATYRYALGTSMAAPAISGFLALIQEYFEVRGNSAPLPPAAYKAILANCARSTESIYYPDFTQPLNYTGWGLPSLVNALSGGFLQDGQTNLGLYSTGIATGQAESYTIHPSDLATNAPLRITLSWTDPAGNPAAAIRLVNNLDLLVTNSTGSNVFIGNNFLGTGFTVPVSTNDLAADTSSVLFDYVNNTEQIVIQPPLDKTYVITVIGRRVNVNAASSQEVTSGTNATDLPVTATNVVQDYVLVFNSDAAVTTPGLMGSLSNNAATPAMLAGTAYQPPANQITNGIPRFNDRAGANSPLIGGLAGTTNQWHFYVFTNALDTNASALTGLTNGSNVAFVTFLPPNLSQPRGSTVTNVVYDNFGNLISRQVVSQGEADIDLYVSQDPGLLSLTDDAVLHALKSVSRGGTEYVIITNAPANGEIYYIGVKSEDQQAGEYSFVTISSNEEFSKQGTNGIELRGLPLVTPIPDGTPGKPGVGRFMALGLDSHSLRRAIVSQVINHSNLLDLQGQIRHVNSAIEINDHRPFRNYYGGQYFNAGQITNIVDDSGSLTYPTSQNSDGPGSLNNFMGIPISGPWFLNSIDSAAGQTGRVDKFTMIVQPNLFGLQQVVTNTVQPNAIEAEVIDVPADADSLTIKIGIKQPALPLELFIKRNDFPVITNLLDNDLHATILPPGGTNVITYRSVPPLQAGRYIVAVFNPNSVAVTYTIQGIITHNLPGKYSLTLKGGPETLTDLATTINNLTVADNRPVTDLKVGLRILDPRVSDLAIRLQTPDGKQALIFEDRGRSTTAGLGGEILSTNYQHVAFSFDRLTRLASLYFNGQLVSSAVLSTNIVVDTSGDFYFGVDPSGKFVTNQNRIRLDDFGLWRRTLRDDEIQSLFDNGFFGRGKTESMTNNGLVSWWTMDTGGSDAVGTNTITLAAGVTNAAGQIDGAQEFPARSAGGRIKASKSLDPVPGGGMTLEGWIRSPDGNSNIIIGGWLTPTNGFGPALAVLPGAPGNLTVVFHDRSSNAFVLGSQNGLITASGTTTNVSYATFIDDPTGSPVPIKFATPPYLDKVFQAVVTNTGFEVSTKGIYITNTLADGWLVTTNSVEIVNDPINAVEGVQYLQLQNGVVKKEYFLPLGRRYLMHFAYRQAPGYNGAAEAQVVLNGIGTSHLFGTAAWQTNTIALQNSDSRFEIQFQALEPSSALTNIAPGLVIDNIIIEQQADTAGLLPEEAYTDLLGTMSGGTWGLQVTDSRGDVNNTDTGTLVSWELQLTLAPDTVPIIGLTNGVPFDGVTSGATAEYFYVDVPPETVLDQISLTPLDSVALNLRYSDRGVPDGTDPSDFTLMTNVLSGTNLVALNATNGPPLLPLLPRGGRYYLAVSRTDGGTDPANFRIKVEHVFNIIPLTNSIAYNGTNTSPGLLDYYSYNVSTNALAVEFSVSNMLADVNLVASKSPSFPSRTFYNYSSMNSGTNPEYIAIDPSSRPVPLTPGLWYLGVYNTGSTLSNITYSVMARELTAANMRPLDSSQVLSNSVAAGGTDYYYFDISDLPFQASVDLTAMPSNLDLYVSKHLPLPGPSLYDFSSTRPGTSPEDITWDYFSTPPLAAGRWYAAVVNTNSGAVPYKIGLSFDGTVGPGYQILTEDIPVTNSAAGPLDQFYKFTVTGGVGAVMFEIYGLTGPADMVASPDDFPGVATTQFSDIQPGTTPEQIIVQASDIDYLTRDWYLRVSVPAGTNSTYTVRATTDRSGLLVSGNTTLTAVFTPTNVVFTYTGVPNQYYQLDTTTNLVPPIVWTPVLTNQAPARVVQILIQPPDPADEQRYYQLEQIIAP